MSTFSPLQTCSALGEKGGKNTSIPRQQPSYTLQLFILLRFSGGKSLLNVFKTKFQMSRMLYSHKSVHDHRLVHGQKYTCRKIHAHTEPYMHTHTVKDSEKLPVCQFLSQCLPRLADKLFYNSPDKRCRGQLCSSDLETQHQKETIRSSSSQILRKDHIIFSPFYL